MKNFFAIAAIILLPALGFYIGKGFGGEAELQPTWNDVAIREVHKHVALELTRNWSHTIEDREGAGRGIIEYHWHFTYMFGFEIPKGWDWKISRKDGVLSLSVPPLKQLNDVHFGVDSRREFNKASGKRKTRMENDIRDIGVKAIKDGARELLKDRYVVKMAKLSFARNIQDLINQANPKNLTHEVMLN